MLRTTATTLLAILALAAATAGANPPAHLSQPTTRAGAPATRPAPPVLYATETRDNPPLRVHVVIADLTNPAVHVKVSRGGADPNMTKPWETTLLTVTGMVERDGMAAAVNGCPFHSKDFETILGRKYPYYDGNWAMTVGWNMSDGIIFSERPKFPDWPTLIVTGQNHVAIGKFSQLPPDTTQAVAGNAQILLHGQNIAPLDDRGSNDIGVAPRTGAGVSPDGKKLILVVVDGRRPGFSVGVTEHQLGEEMRRLGAWDAINLDGGGSSAMAIRDPDGSVNLVNRPSDGHDLLFPLSVERSVADALGVIVDYGATVGTGTVPGN
ncbi:MAG: phosphodiester glycosidase family protein [Tepidisphaeraceae bacterium]|jgi:exopolysaccharide biosynthesis protein